MTILGKLLAILVFILSIAWTALTVNAYVTRTNWQKQAKDAQAKAKEAADAATAMKNLLDTEREAAEEARRSVAAERDRLYDQNVQLLKDRDALMRQYNDAFGDAKTQAAKAAIQQANIDKLQKQVDSQDQQIRDKDKQLTDMTLSSQADRVAAERSRLDADAQRQRADRLEAKVQQQASELEEYRRQVGPLRQRGPGEQGPTPTPQDFRGNVTSRDGTERDLAAGRDVLVTLTPGLDAGLRPGAVLTVHRSGQGAGRYLGTVTVITANAKDAVGRFTPAAGRRATADDLPKPGDELIPNSR